jgi:hypothetical protein
MNAEVVLDNNRYLSIYSLYLLTYIYLIILSLYDRFLKVYRNDDELQSGVEYNLSKLSNSIYNILFNLFNLSNISMSIYLILSI